MRCPECGMRNRHPENGERCKPCRHGEPVDHGVAATYSNRGCRCEPCRLAYNQWRRETAAPECRSIIEYICTVCTKPFLGPKHVNGRKLCSDACRKRKHSRDARQGRARRKLAKAAAGVGPTWNSAMFAAGNCLVCDTPVIFIFSQSNPGGQRVKSRYCSDECSERNRRAARYSAKNHRTRAQKYGVPYEPIDNIEVYDRDGWICGICDEPVDPRLKYPDTMSASLDHVIAMANGGPHLYGNVQCSHWICNVVKSDTGDKYVGDTAA